MAHRMQEHMAASSSSSTAAAANDAGEPLMIIAAITLCLAFVYFGVLRYCYGSYSLSAVVRTYKARRQLEEEYNTTYQKREDMVFHRDWAKSRGDFAEARRMETELVGIEAELDALDDKLGKFDGGAKYN